MLNFRIIRLILRRLNCPAFSARSSFLRDYARLKKIPGDRAASLTARLPETLFLTVVKKVPIQIAEKNVSS
jgi:hypothetical protein